MPSTVSMNFMGASRNKRNRRTVRQPLPPAKIEPDSGAIVNGHCPIHFGASQERSLHRVAIYLKFANSHSTIYNCKRGRGCHADHSVIDRYSLVRDDGQWKIDDISGASPERKPVTSHRAVA